MSTRNEPLTESYYYILLCLYQKSNHGYGIMQEAERLSEGTVKIGSGTMYGATSNMMKKGWIREKMSDEPADRRKRLYELTAEGKEALMEETGRMWKQIQASQRVMEGM